MTFSFGNSINSSSQCFTLCQQKICENLNDTFKQPNLFGAALRASIVVISGIATAALCKFMLDWIITPLAIGATIITSVVLAGCLLCYPESSSIEEIFEKTILEARSGFVDRLTEPYFFFFPFSFDMPYEENNTSDSKFDSKSEGAD